MLFGFLPANHQGTSFIPSLKPMKFVSRCSRGVIMMTMSITSAEKLEENQSRATIKRSSHAPPTKSSWSTTGSGAPLLSPSRLFTKLPIMSPSIAPADSASNTMMKRGKEPKEPL